VLSIAASLSSSLGCSASDPGAVAAAPTSELTWSTAAPCPVARFEANGAIVDDELWVMGGFTAPTLDVTRRIDIYNPETDTWRQGPDLPGAETHVAVIVVGRDIILAGGFSGPFTDGVHPPTTDAVFRWSADGSEWVAGPSLPAPGAAFAWALLDGRLHLAGGLRADGHEDSPYHYAWQTDGGQTWDELADLLNPRNHGGGAASGRIFYAIGGRHQWDENGSNVADVEAFDPDSGAWTTRASLPVGRSEIGASTSALSDGRILVVGGSLNGIMPSDDVLVYAPAEDSWSALTKLPEKRKGAVAVQIGRRLVVTTGSPTSIDPIATTFVGCCL
jgi:N-acetylneuraminic acid mutarotase